MRWVLFKLPSLTRNSSLVTLELPSEQYGMLKVQMSFPNVSKWIVVKFCWNLQHDVVTTSLHIKSSTKVLIFVSSNLLKIWLSSFSHIFGGGGWYSQINSASLADFFWRWWLCENILMEAVVDGFSLRYYCHNVNQFIWPLTKLAIWIECY